MNDLEGILGSAEVAAILDDGRTALAITVPDGTAAEHWHRLRAAYDSTGLWPFLLDTTGDRDLVWADATEGTKWGGQKTALQILGQEPWSHGDIHLPAEPRPGRLLGGDTDQIGLLPVAAGGWYIPQLLRWSGAGNNGLSGTDTSTVLAHWHTRYGAELMVLTHDTLELLVPNPPTDPDEVGRVALQQDAFCPDIGDPLECLVEEQVHSHHWFFWWD